MEFLPGLDQELVHLIQGARRRPAGAVPFGGRARGRRCPRARRSDQPRVPAGPGQCARPNLQTDRAVRADRGGPGQLLRWSVDAESGFEVVEFGVEVGGGLVPDGGEPVLDEGDLGARFVGVEAKWGVP